MSHQDPADAVREALDILRLVLDGRIAGRISEWPQLVPAVATVVAEADRLAALAGAAPVASKKVRVFFKRTGSMREDYIDVVGNPCLHVIPALITRVEPAPMMPHAPAKAREDDCAERCKRRHPHTQLTVTRYIAPDSLWFWNVTMPDGHMFDLGKGFDSAEAAMTDAAGAGMKALHKAETFARAALATFAEGAAPAKAREDDAAAIGWKACRRQVFALCEHTQDNAGTSDFDRGRAYEANGIAKAMNAFGPESCDELRAAIGGSAP